MSNSNNIAGLLSGFRVDLGVSRLIKDDVVTYMTSQRSSFRTGWKTRDRTVSVPNIQQTQSIEITS